MRVISRFAVTAFDEPEPDQRVKLFKELARLRASDPRRAETALTATRQREPHTVEQRGGARPLERPPPG